MNISNTKRESPRGIEYLFDHIRAKGFVNQVASFRNNNSKFRNRFTGTAAVLDFEQHPHGRREGNAFVADQCQDLNSRFRAGSDLDGPKMSVIWICMDFKRLRTGTTS